jgi:hypothetical protein
MQTISPYILIGPAGTSCMCAIPFTTPRIATRICIVIRPERALLPALPLFLSLLLPLLLPSLA